MATEFQMVAKTFKGLEDVLATELVQLGANNIQLERRAVSFTGDLALLYRANLYLRTASRVLVPILSFKADDADGVYEEVKKINWADYMNLQTGFAIDATVYSEEFRHSKYVTYRVKDAIADWWMEREQKRPNVRVTDPDLMLNVHIAGKQVTLSLDSSGESLHKRGYRVANTEAPINEALAAGMLLMAGWKGETDFYDPMCGSGTLLIEAALIAQNIAPGIFRKSFAFEKWNNFNAELWEEVYNDDSRERVFEHKIYGSDAGFYAVQAALKNIKSAGQSRYIEVRQVRIEELHDLPLPADKPAPKALVMMNPPYGERLSQDKDVLRLYQAIGSALKHQFTGATAWIISSNEEAMKCLGLKPSEKIHLMNGELDCMFNKYELFQGERKQFVAAHPKDKASAKPMEKKNRPTRKSDGSFRAGAPKSSAKGLGEKPKKSVPRQSRPATDRSSASRRPRA